MQSTSRNHVKHTDLPLVLKGQEGRSVALRILFVHSNAAHVEDCVQELRKAHFKVSVDVVLTLEQFAGRLRSKYYDVVLAEYPTQNLQSLQALEILQQMDRQIPFIFVTETMQLETVAELITEGASD
jgi:DNA-binding NtrC family response regulator